MNIGKYLISSYRSAANPPPVVDFDGVWKNGLGSDMNLAVSKIGEVTGTYRTGVGAPTLAEECPLVGFASGDLITFTVNFGKYGSLTSWTGQNTEEGGDSKIHTLWHLAKNIIDEDEPKNLWAGILVGANIFFRQKRRRILTPGVVSFRGPHRLADTSVQSGLFRCRSSIGFLSISSQL